MKIENTQVFGFEAALCGMRNPMNSWDKSDSYFCYEGVSAPENPTLGPNDLKLSTSLIKRGTEHRKFLRQIQVWVDLTLPIYVWSEFDTYKVGVTRNSCSTMHKLGSVPLTEEDFQQPVDVLDKLNNIGQEIRQLKLLSKCESNRKRVRELRYKMKGILPASFLQKATVTMNYENVINMYFQRRKHELPEWNESNPSSICSWIKKLPLMDKWLLTKNK